MVENIRELGRTCQKPNYKTVGNWMVRHIERDAALYITWVLLHTPVTAHQVTGFALAVAIVAGVCLASASASVFLFGAMLLQFWYLLDHVDGQIARYRKTASADGLFYDYMMHHIVNFIPFFATGWAGWQFTGHSSLIVLGFVASISSGLIAILNDCRSKAVLSTLMAAQHPVRVVNPEVPTAGRRESISFAKRVFSLMHKSSEGHVTMNVLTVFAVIYWLLESAEFMPALFFVLLGFYAVVPTVVWVMKLNHWVGTGAISGEYAKSFVILEREERAG